MPTFKYAAKDQTARDVVGKISAENQNAVIEELRKRNLTIISVTVVKEAGPIKFSFARKKVRRLWMQCNDSMVCGLTKDRSG